MNILNADVKSAYARFQILRTHADAQLAKSKDENRVGMMENVGFPALFSIIVLIPLWLATALSGYWIVPIIGVGVIFSICIGFLIFYPGAVFSHSAWKKKTEESTRKAVKNAEDARKKYLQEIRKCLAVRDDLKIPEPSYDEGFNSTFFVIHTMNDKKQHERYTLEVIEGTPCFMTKDGKLLTRGYDADGKLGVYSETGQGKLFAVDDETLRAIHSL